MSNEDTHGKSEVTITVDEKKVTIHRGHQTVAEIKRLGGVKPNDVLAIVADGQPLRDLPQDGAVTLKGGEVFISHLPDGGSS